MSVSQNGYRVLESHETKKWAIPGTGRHLILAPYAPGFLLAHFALWFHQNVEPLGDGTWDDWGFAVRDIRGSSTISNHASGTAMDLNATKHPLGKRGTFTAAQTRMIRRRLKVYRGCIRWGGDYSGRPDEMHFEVDRDRRACRRVYRMLRPFSRARRLLAANP